MPAWTRPPRVRFRQQNMVLEVLQSGSQLLKLALEDDVVAGANAVQQGCWCVQAKVVHIAEHRHHRCNSASRRKQNNAPVLALVEAEVAEGAVGLDRHSHGRTVVQKYRGAPLAYTFWRNLYVTRSGR